MLACSDPVEQRKRKPFINNNKCFWDHSVNRWEAANWRAELTKVPWEHLMPFLFLANYKLFKMFWKRRESIWVILYVVSWSAVIEKWKPNIAAFKNLHAVQWKSRDLMVVSSKEHALVWLLKETFVILSFVPVHAALSKTQPLESQFFSLSNERNNYLFFFSCRFRELTWLTSGLDNERRKQDGVPGKAVCGYLFHSY